MKKFKIDGKYFVKVSCIAGIFILLFFIASLLWTFIRTGSMPGFKNQFDKIPFAEKLDKFDNIFNTFKETGQIPNTDTLTLLFNSLDRSSLGAEGELSVLKRRRLLAKSLPAFMPDYFSAVEKAAAKFQHSALIAALAGEAFVWKSTQNAESGYESGVLQKINSYAEVLANAGPLGENSFFPLAFCLYSLSGTMQNIESAKSITNIDDLFLTGIRNFSGAEFEALSINAALLKIIDKKIDNAAAFLVPLDAEHTLSKKGQTFFSNYSYDFGNLILAAKLWTKSQNPTDIARAADALFLAGRYENAVQLWQILADGTGNDGINAKIRRQSLYNISSIMNTAGKIPVLERLLAESNGDFNDPPLMYGIILYTRLISENRAKNILEETTGKLNLPIFDLELLRHKIKKMPIDKSIADTWLLIDRHYENPMIYRWAAWYFDFQRQFNETEFLAGKAQNRNVSGIWVPFNNALKDILAGNYKSGIEILKKIEEDHINNEKIDEEIWPVYADMALSFEVQYDYRNALKYFKTARENIIISNNISSLDKNSRRRNAALLELKIARCLDILGIKEEAQQAVLNAAALDGENINVRIALDKLKKQ
jgi:hypothetical protein